MPYVLYTWMGAYKACHSYFRETPGWVFDTKVSVDQSDCNTALSFWLGAAAEDM